MTLRWACGWVHSHITNSPFHKQRLGHRVLDGISMACRCHAILQEAIASHDYYIETCHSSKPVWLLLGLHCALSIGSTSITITTKLNWIKLHSSMNTRQWPRLIVISTLVLPQHEVPGKDFYCLKKKKIVCISKTPSDNHLVNVTVELNGQMAH